MRQLLREPEMAVTNCRRRKIDLDCSRLLQLAKAAKLADPPAKDDPELVALLASLPNDTEQSVPEENATMETINGHLPPIPIVEHADMDTEGGVRATGSKGFYFLTGQMALLEQALVQYGLRTAMQHGFLPIACPDLVAADAVAKSGFQPRKQPGEHDPIFRLDAQSSEDLVLAGTSEVTMLSRFRQRIVPKRDLPSKFVAVSHCFRRELGHSLGAIYRVHQFTKVELFVLSRSDDPVDYLRDVILPVQRQIIQDLQMPARVLAMAPDELGLSSRRKFDIEVAFCKENSESVRWGEVSSASDCGSFQSERFGIRWSDGAGLPVRGFVHTWNGTCIAVPRVLMALAGVPSTPLCLKPYLP